MSSTSSPPQRELASGNYKWCNEDFGHPPPQYEHLLWLPVAEHGPHAVGLQNPCTLRGFPGTHSRDRKTVVLCSWKYSYLKIFKVHHIQAPMVGNFLVQTTRMIKEHNFIFAQPSIPPNKWASGTIQPLMSKRKLKPSRNWALLAFLSVLIHPHFLVAPDGGAI